MSLDPTPQGMGDGIFDGVLDIVKNAASGAVKGAASGVDKKPPTKATDNSTIIILAIVAFMLMSKR